MSWREKRSFGPIVQHEPDDSLQALCTWCVFRVGSSCTYVKPSRQIPDPENTPEWCELREDMIRDAKEMWAKRRMPTWRVPSRIQLSRRKGFSLQAHSHDFNGLLAVNVARPSRWGNPYRVGIDGTAAECVARYRAFLIGTGTDLSPLRGKNLACWCEPEIGTLCHADILLELANDEEPPEGRIGSAY